MLQSFQDILYLVRKPKDDKKQLKLLILLHGYGSNEEDLFSFSDEFPDHFLVMSLRGTLPTVMGGFSWYDIHFENQEKFTNTEQAKNSLKQIAAFVNGISVEYSFDTNDVWLCGFSQGAILSYALAIQHPNLFKHMMCLSGYPETSIIGEIDTTDRKELSFYVSHGTEDAVIPIDWARNAKKILSELNCTFEYKEYFSGHGINPENYRDLMLWIMQHDT